MVELARSHPDKYREAAHKIGTLGREASYYQGNTVSMDDMKQVIDMKRVYALMDAELADVNSSGEDTATKRKLREGIYVKYADSVERDTMKAGLKAGNSWAKFVASGARGKGGHLKAIVSTPGVFQDASGNIVPLFVRNSYAQGVRPAELLAGTYGGRSAVVSTKVATAKGGDFGKILVQAAAGTTITQGDCGIDNGIDLPGDDSSLRGRVLAKPIAGFDAGTVIDKFVAGKLKKIKEPVIVRSALTCGAEHGICAKCAGLEASGKFPPIGSSIGITSAQSISEPITQMALNVKHGGGQASGKKSYSGFEYINQFVQVPEAFTNAAAITTADGIITEVRKAPQGGSYIKVDDKEYYIPTGIDPTVKTGDSVEQGDTLSTGLENPAEIVKYKGLGRGRRYYVDRLERILADSNVRANKRALEVVARSTVNHVRVRDPKKGSDLLPDDLVSMEAYTRGNAKPQDTTTVDTASSLHKFIQTPVLHYTPGTRVTKQVQKRLTRAGVSTIDVSEEAPEFEAEMQRLRTASHNNKDWLASLQTSYLKQQLTEAAEGGYDTNVESNRHFAPKLAVGVGFGEGTERKGEF